MSAPAPTPRALVVGGLDPSAGAGVLLDAFVVARLGYQPAVVATTVTAQNSANFEGSWPVVPAALIAQLDALLAEGGFACVKIGALGSDALAIALAKWLARAKLPFVVSDPVLASSSGGALVEGALTAVNAVARVSAVITPNAEEAGRLAGVAAIGEDAVSAVAQALSARYGCAVGVTGLPGRSPEEAIDVLAEPGRSVVRVPHSLVAGVGDVRGTGCMFSSALACHLADGLARRQAISAAHATVRELLGSARPIGRGRWQVDLPLLWASWHSGGQQAL